MCPVVVPDIVPDMAKRWVKWLGMAGLAGVAATGAVIARQERERRSYTPEQVRSRLHERLTEAEQE